MSYDDIIEVLAAALLEKADTVGCLEVLDGFSQRPDTEIEVSAPISEKMLALPLDKQEWPEECTPILKESGAATLGELVEYLNHCTATGKKLNVSEDAAAAMFPALITFCYDAADAGVPSGCALRRSAEFAGFLPHDLYRCADADYRELP